jgi:hypothetical protein
MPQLGDGFLPNDKESDLNLKKKILMTVAGLSMVVGMAGTAAAGASSLQSSPAKPAASASASQGAQTTKAATTVAASTNAVNTHAVGCNYWYTWHYLGNVWVDSYYCGPYYSYPWWPYYRIYDNFKVCNSSGYNCISAQSWTWQDYLYYWPLHTWYYYGPSGYSTSHELVGYGPYSS